MKEEFQKVVMQKDDEIRELRKELDIQMKAIEDEKKVVRDKAYEVKALRQKVLNQDRTIKKLRCVKN